MVAARLKPMLGIETLSSPGSENAAVRHLGGRKDVDRRRIAVIGYADGGPVALIAAAKDDRITAAALTRFSRAASSIATAAPSL